MKNLRQLLHRAGWVKSNKRSRPRSKMERRQLITQTLEKRELLAGDVGYNPNHNYHHGLDANDNQAVTALDALVIMNHQSRKAALGEDVDTGGLKLDTNNDGQITSADALAVMNGIRSGEGVGELVEYLLTARDVNDQELPTDINGNIPVVVDQQFKLEASYIDRRGFSAIGAFQFFGDIIASTAEGVVEDADNGNPVQITSAAHGLNTGDTVVIEKAIGDGGFGAPLNINGTHTITVVSPNAFTLNGVDGTGTESYVSGGRWMRTPGTLKPVLRETQRLVFEETVGDANSGTFEFTLDNSNLTYTSQVSVFTQSLQAAQDEIVNALAAFGYSPDQYELTRQNTGDGKLRYQIHYLDMAFGNVDLPNISVAAMDTNVSVDVDFIEFAPFEDDDVTPNSDAVRFNLDTRSRTFDDNDVFYGSLNEGDFEMFTGFDEVGGTGGIPTNGGGIPELAENGRFDQPFDVFSLWVFFESANPSLVDVSVNPGEQAEALLLYGDNDPVAEDLILLDEDARLTFLVRGAVDDFDPVFNPTVYNATVDEDISDSTPITTVTATDADPDDTVIYSIIAGDPSGLFEINSTTGVVSLASGRNLDAETTTSHNLTVQASESNGPATDTAAVNITVLDVDEFDVGPVTDSNGNPNTIAEDAAPGTPVQITAFATDNDLTNNTISYSLAAGVADNDLFQIDSVSGVVTLSGSLDAETDNSLTIEVTATSTDTSSNTGQFTISVTDVNEDPVGAVNDNDPNANAISENATAGTPVRVTALAVDPDVSDTVSYSLAANTLDNNLFQINATTGVVTLLTSGSLSGQANSTKTIEVTATSTDTSSSTGQFMITVVEVDDFDVGPVTDTNAAANAIAEDAIAGTPVQITAFAEDLDTSNNTVTYSLAANTLDNNLFEIDANSGVVTLKTTGSLDAETSTSHTIEVTATSADTSTSSEQFTINVIDVNEFSVGPVTDSNGQANTIAENASAGTSAKITASASDDDVSNNTITYSLATNTFDNDLFVIDPNSGVVTLKTDRGLDGEAGNNKIVEVTATSSDTSSNTAQFTVTVTESNDPPIVATTDLTGAVTELISPVGNLTDSGTIAFSDVDINDVHSIDSNIVASSGALGNLTASVTTQTDGSGAGGVITWNYTVAAADVEFLARNEQKVETFALTLDDGNSGTVTRTVTVTIGGTNDAPVFSDGPDSVGLTETNAGLTASGSLTVSDVDITDSVTAAVNQVSVSGTGASRVPASLTNSALLGFLSVTPTAILNSSQTSNSLTWNFNSGNEAFNFLAATQTLILAYNVGASDGLASDSENVTVTINGSNDAPVSAPPVTASFNKTDSPGSVDLLQNASDVDGDALSVTLATPTSGDAGGITFNSATNQLDVDPSFYADLAGSIDVVFDVTISDGSATVSTTATVSIVAFPPTDLTGTLFIDERSASSPRNGMKDDGEKGLGGVGIHLRSDADDNSTGEDVNLTSVTNADGEYLIAGVAPGTYELEYELPPQVVFVGERIFTVVVDPEGGVTVPTMTFAALGLSGDLASVDILASTHLNSNGPLSRSSNGGAEGGSVKLAADGSQQLIVLGEGFEEAEFVEFVLNTSQTAAAITKVVNGVRSTASVGSDHFVVGNDGSSVRFFGGSDDFIFNDMLEEEFPALGMSVDEYFRSIGQFN